MALGGVSATISSSGGRTGAGAQELSRQVVFAAVSAGGSANTLYKPASLGAAIETLKAGPLLRAVSFGFQAAAKVSLLNQIQPATEMKPTGRITPQTVIEPNGELTVVKTETSGNLAVGKAGDGKTNQSRCLPSTVCRARSAVLRKWMH